jgi:hypothetical protein
VTRLNGKKTCWALLLALIFLSYIASNQPLVDVQSFNHDPTIGDFQAPETVYAGKYFYLNATVDDGLGRTDLAYATIELAGLGIFRWDALLNVFSESSDPNDYFTLDPYNSIRTPLNFTAYRLSWRMKIAWIYPEDSISILETNTLVADSVWGGGTNSHPDLASFEDDLIVSSTGIKDSRVDPNNPLIITGTIFYDGTSIPPSSGSSALSFDGLTDYVEVVDSPSLRNRNHNERTLALWLYLNHFSGGAGHLIRINGVENIFGIKIDSLGNFWSDGKTTSATRSMGLGFTYTDLLHSWQHLALVYNGTHLQFYLNGEKTVVWSLVGTWSDNEVVLKFPYTPNTFEGVIDEVRVYNRGLSAEDVQELYRGTYRDETDLTLYLDLDGDYADKSGSGNHGRNFGATWVDGFTNIDVKVELDSMVKQTVGIVNATDGSFAAPLTAETLVDQYTYKVYAVSDETSTQNKTVDVHVDQFKVMDITTNDYRRNVATPATINVTLNYESDGTAVTTGSFTLNDLPLKHQGSGIWQTTDNKSEVQAVTYDSVTGFGDTYDLHTVNLNKQNVTVIWDQLNVVIEPSPEHPYLGEKITLQWWITRQYDDSSVTNFIINLTKDDALWKDTLTTNSTTDLENEAVSHIYNCTAILDDTYGLTTWISNPITVTWAERGGLPSETSDTTTMIYIDPMSLILLVVGFTWLVIVVSLALSLRQ